MGTNAALMASAPDPAAQTSLLRGLPNMFVKIPSCMYETKRGKTLFKGVARTLCCLEILKGFPECDLATSTT